MAINDLSLGMTASLSTNFSLEEVTQFAMLSKDQNPIHLNEDFAKDTIFKKPIVHGILVSSLISALIANHLPGPGSIYKSQQLNFIRPVFHSEEVTAKVTITKLVIEKRIVELETVVYKNGDEGEVVINGTAIIKLV